MIPVVIPVVIPIIVIVPVIIPVLIGQRHLRGDVCGLLLDVIRYIVCIVAIIIAFRARSNWCGQALVVGVLCAYRWVNGHRGTINRRRSARISNGSVRNNN